MKRNINYLTYLTVLLLLFTVKSNAQNCIQTSQYPSGTVAIASTGTTTVTTCNYAGEYSIDSFTAVGSYTINSTGGAGNYITVTDNANNVVLSGTAPLAVTIPSVGIYRIHISLNSSCTTDAACHTVTVARVLPPCLQTFLYPSATTSVAGAGTTQVSACNYGGDYSVNSFTATGPYIINGVGGTGNFFTVTDNANNLLSGGVGPAPLSITIPSVGLYRIHVSTNSSCGTDVTCHTVTIVSPVPVNDLCTNSILLSIPSTSAGTTLFASTESPNPGTCVTSLGQPGVWYRVVGNGNQFGASLCGTTGWDSKIFVYSGACGAFTCVTGNDDNGPLCTGASASATWCSVPSVTYNILVTGFSSANNFTIAVTETVNPSTPTVTIVAASASVCLTSSTALTASGAATYTWSTGATTASISVTPTASTVYTVRGRASTGCGTDTKTISITTLTTPIVSISANSASICPGGSFVVTASGANSYSFNGSPSGTVITTAGSATLSPIVNTTYTVYGTATNGCRSVLAASPVVTVATLVSPTLVTSASPASVCPNATSTITVSGANTYTWIAPASNATQITVSPSVTTIYTVSGTGTNVCNGFKTVTVTTYPQPTVTVNSGTLCAGSVFTMVPGGAATYTYSSGSNTVNPSADANYTVVGTSSLGCISANSAVASVSVFALPVVTASSGTMCVGSFYNILPSGATNYTVINAGNPVSPSVTTTYSVIGTTSIGCVSLPALSTVTVFNLPIVTVASTPSNNVICNASPITMNASGANTYTWNGTVSGPSVSATPSASGSYYVIGTDANGCTNVATIPFTVNPQPALAFATTNTFVCAGGSATLTAGGASNYTFSTGSNATLQVVSPTVNTVYSLTGDNSFGCTKTLSLTVSVNTIVMTVSSNTEICIGASANLSAIGAANYTWAPVSSPFSAITVTPAVTTTYSVIGKDSKACFHNGMVTVTVNPNPVVTASGSPSLICVGESATLTASGANSYLWSVGSATNNTGSPLVITPTNANTFNYLVTGTDENGCTGVDTVSLKVEKCTGLSSNSKEMNGISVYPNPNNGSFKVEWINGLKKSINVTDVTGRLILSTESSEDVMDVNLNAFANGIYYVKVQSESTVEVIRVIKQ